MERVQRTGENSSLSLCLICWLSATVFFAAGRALGVNEGNLAGEAGKASEEEGTSAISKAGTSARFVLCLGLLMKSM